MTTVAIRADAQLLSVDPELSLRLPSIDCADPEVTILIPALNEKLTIADFVDWCHQGLKAAGRSGEVLIVDSSNDGTGDIALAHGARVLKAPKRGLGRAYIDAQPFVRGKFIIMGDCDCTYDFRELKPFVDAFRSGHEFVMGSRFKGTIDDGAMPALHRYFGTPGTTWILNRIFSSHFSDIHCGMRGMTKDAFARLQLRSQSWEYASEMVVKSVHLNLKTTEVPIHFLKDREGRLSHHKRSGWFSPWQAGWINLRAMFIYGADFFLFRPGLVLFLVGLALALPVLAGPVAIGPVTLSLNWMLVGVTLATLGVQCVYSGVVAQVLYDPSDGVLERWLKRLRYTPAVASSAIAFCLGVAMGMPLVFKYAQGGLRLAGPDWRTHLAVGGLLVAILSFMTFTFTLVLHALGVSRRRVF